MLRFMSLTLFCTMTSLVIAADLHIQGSNTIGANLGPALVAAMLAEQGLHDIHSVPVVPPNEHSIVGTNAQGQQIRVDVAAHGSGTGFAALASGQADLVASSRPIKDRELVDLERLGDLKSPDAEQVIAIDGLAIILHPRNPLNLLNTEQLAQIFSGQITAGNNWAASAAPSIYMLAIINPAPGKSSRSWS